LGRRCRYSRRPMPEEVAAPYRTALRRLTDAVPPMPAEAARRVIMSDLAAAFGPGWRERLVGFRRHPPLAAAIDWPGCNRARLARRTEAGSWEGGGQGAINRVVGPGAAL